VTACLKILRCSPILLVVACAAPKATVIEEPKKKQEMAKQDTLPSPPIPSEAEQLRTPDVLGKLPDKNEFQATNPKATGMKSEGAPVIARPPNEGPGE
jgi:hypothetical protein